MNLFGRMIDNLTLKIRNDITIGYLFRFIWLAVISSYAPASLIATIPHFASMSPYSIYIMIVAGFISASLCTFAHCKMKNVRTSKRVICLILFFCYAFYFILSYYYADYYIFTIIIFAVFVTMFLGIRKVNIFLREELSYYTEDIVLLSLLLAFGIGPVIPNFIFVRILMRLACLYFFYLVMKKEIQVVLGYERDKRLNLRPLTFRTGTEGFLFFPLGICFGVQIRWLGGDVNFFILSFLCQIGVLLLIILRPLKEENKAEEGVEKDE